MEFNSYLWNLYCGSDDGKVALGRSLTEHWAPPARDLPPFHASLFVCEVEADGKTIVEDGQHGADLFDLRELINSLPDLPEISSLEQAEEFFSEIADGGLGWNFDEEGVKFLAIFGGGSDDPDAYADFYDGIEGLTAGLNDIYPDYFLPYFFKYNFDKLETICKSFDIDLPEIPGKLKKRERALFYFSINRQFQDFRRKHNLSPQELNAFLYDFAQRNLPSIHSKDLPSPSRVWFVIGGVGENGDFEYLDQAADDTVSYWQGNLETRDGDIVLMWCASPRSHLHSVWRALGNGFLDPFFHYYSMIRVGYPVKVTPLRFSEIAKHPILGSKPAVRAHFQGRSGSAFSIEDYSAICELLQQKGFDIGRLPTPPLVQEFPTASIQNERDVELQLLEPLLRNLGYSDNDWVRQLPVRMGRGERNYPDYVLGCDPRPGEECGVAVVECKLNIDTPKELKEAFIQAKSYALRLQASILTLAARRGIWLYSIRSDGFSLDNFVFKTWNELTHPDVLHDISLIIGKRLVIKHLEDRKRGCALSNPINRKLPSNRH